MNPLRVPRRNEDDWRMMTTGKDVLVYTLAEDLEITGQILAKLFVSSSAPDTDFSIRLLDVAPDGTPRSFTLNVWKPFVSMSQAVAATETVSMTRRIRRG